MKHLKFIILLLIIHCSLLSQTITPYEDFYESGKIHVRGYTIQVDSISSTSTGLWTYWYENGNKLSEEIRNDPNLTKYINCWTGDGKQICINGNGKFYKTWTDFYDDSTVYTIKDNVQQGSYVSYLPLKKGYRKVAEGTFVNGQRQGDVTYYYETGEIRCIQNYTDDKQNGLRKLFYRNGKVREQGLQKESIRDSIWTFFTPEGIVEKNITYESNRQKYLVEYFSNGAIKSRGGFTQIKAKPIKKKPRQISSGRTTTKRGPGTVSVKNGEWLYFDKTGKLVKKEMYLDGKLKKQDL